MWRRTLKALLLRDELQLAALAGGVGLAAYVLLGFIVLCLTLFSLFVCAALTVRLIGSRPRNTCVRFSSARVHCRALSAALSVSFPYLVSELPLFPTDADCRACIDRVVRLVGLDAPPPAVAEWLELFGET